MPPFDASKIHESQPKLSRSVPPKNARRSDLTAMSDPAGRLPPDVDVLNINVKNARQDAVYWRRRYDELKAELLESGILSVCIHNSL